MTKLWTDWPKKLDAAFKRKFGIKALTFFDLIGAMRYVTSRADGKPMTKAQKAFIDAWMADKVPAKVS